MRPRFVQIYKSHRNQLYVLYLKDQSSENRTLEVTILLNISKYHLGKAIKLICSLISVRFRRRKETRLASHGSRENALSEGLGLKRKVSSGSQSLFNPAHTAKWQSAKVAQSRQFYDSGKVKDRKGHLHQSKKAFDHQLENLQSLPLS